MQLDIQDEENEYELESREIFQVVGRLKMCISVLAG